MEESCSVIILTALLLSPVIAENLGYSVEEEYNKGYGVTPERVATLRDWVSTQPHLPGEYITDLDLVFAFNRSNGCLEDARQKLDHYFTVKTMFTELFKDRVMSDWWLTNTFNAAPMFDLQMRSKKGQKILFLTFNKNSEDFDMTDLCKYVLMLLDLRQYLEGTWPGVVFIVDLQNFTVRHVDKFQQLTALQRYFYYLESAWMGYLEELHYINPSEVVCDLEKLLQESISKSLLKKVHVHKDKKSFEKHFSLDILPKEAGGTSKSIREFQDITLEDLKANQDYFVADRKKRVDERKRRGGPKSISHIMGHIKENLSGPLGHCEFCKM